MSLSSCELGAVIADLGPRLAGATLQQARACADEPGCVVLVLRAPGQTLALAISATSGATRLHLVADMPKQPSSPPALIMWLRRHAVGRRCAAIEQLDADRIVRLDFMGPELEPVALLAELTGRHGNLFAIAEGGSVATALLPNKSTLRRLRPGEPWRPPAAPPPDHGWLRDGWPATDPHAFVEAIYASKLAGTAFDHRRGALSAAVRRAERRASRKVQAIRRDLERIGQADEFRHHAELLQTRYGQVDRGAEHVMVTDWNTPDQAPVRISLDPSLDLQGNIDRLYSRYRRLQRGRATAEQRLGCAVDEAAELLQLLEDVETVDHDTLSDLEERAPRLRVRIAPPAKQSRRPNDAERLPHHTFMSRDGWRILVGRSSADNDRLTFGIARGNDLWMHAADWPGSHVIVVRPRGRDVPRSTLEDAAQLAAHYCRGRGDSSVAVRYTERKHVRKPRGAPPGRVSVAGARSIDVRPDDDLVAALFATRET